MGQNVSNEASFYQTKGLPMCSSTTALWHGGGCLHKHRLNFTRQQSWENRWRITVHS